MRLLFDLYDTDESGLLSIAELLCLAKSLVRMSGHAGTASHLTAPLEEREDVPGLMCSPRAWSSLAEREAAEQFRDSLLVLDANGDRSVSWEEFRLGINANLHIAMCLAQLEMHGSASAKILFQNRCPHTLAAPVG